MQGNKRDIGIKNRLLELSLFLNKNYNYTQEDSQISVFISEILAICLCNSYSHDREHFF